MDILCSIMQFARLKEHENLTKSHMKSCSVITKEHNAADNRQMSLSSFSWSKYCYMAFKKCRVVGVSYVFHCIELF